MSNHQSDKLIQSKFCQDPDRFYQGFDSNSFDISTKRKFFDYYNNQNSYRKDLHNFEILRWLCESTDEEDINNYWATFGIASNEVTAKIYARLMFDDNPYVPVLILQINHFYDLETYEDIEPDYHRFFGFHRVVSVNGLLPLEACWTKKLRDIRSTQSTEITDF